MQKNWSPLTCGSHWSVALLSVKMKEVQTHQYHLSGGSKISRGGGKWPTLKLHENERNWTKWEGALHWRLLDPLMHLYNIGTAFAILSADPGFPGGTNPKGTTAKLSFGHFLPITSWKWKKIGPWGWDVQIFYYVDPPPNLNNSNKNFIPLFAFYRRKNVHVLRPLFVFGSVLTQTRMHSSRMRISRSWTVCWRLLPGRGVCSGGFSAPGGSAPGGVWSRWGLVPGGGWYLSMHWGRHPSPCGQNHRRL